MEKQPTTIYLDHAATTPLCPAALEAMTQALCGVWGNPSSLHSVGQAARAALEQAREDIAVCLGAASPDEILFTSGGSEADNLALISAAHAGARDGKRHLLSTVFEHHAVLRTLETLATEGFEVELLPVSSDGFVTAARVAAAIRPDTALVSVMYANNEIGTVQPIREIADDCRRRGVLFHTDAVQAVGHIPVDVSVDGMDYLSLSAHKCGGPKGAGVLYVRRGAPLSPMIRGGGQERGMRAGTENLPSILGMVAALRTAADGLEAQMAHVTALRDRLLFGLLALPGTTLNGTSLLDPAHRLPGVINLRFEGVEAETLLLRADLCGLCLSAGSACTAGSLMPSHVLTALGLTADQARSSVRLSPGAENCMSDMVYAVERLTALLSALRRENARKQGTDTD